MPPIVAIVGQSGSGKTTLIEKLIVEFVSRGLRVGTIKHHRHPGDFDGEGKDTWRHRRAGARIAVLAGPTQIVTIADVAAEPSPREIALRHLPDVDLVLAEGYKGGDLPKVEVYRKGLHDALLCGPGDGLIAVATDGRPKTDAPLFGLDDPRPLADLLIRRLLQKE